MNKKISLVVFALGILLFGSGLASAETTVDTTWTGNGFVSTDFVAGDDSDSHFSTVGASISGEFHGKDSDNNPYGYGVDSTNSWVKASVSGYGGGSPNSYMKFEVNRGDSKSSYGAAGQRSYTEIWTDGTAEMAYKSGSNYASMSNGGVNSMPKTSNGRSFEATGNHNIYHKITDSDGDGSSIDVYGYGDLTNSKIRMFGAKSAGSSFNMGSLGVCGDSCAWLDHYADFEGSGTGDFYQHAWADNSLEIGSHDCGSSWTIPGDGNNNSATYDLHVGFSGTWSKSDLGITGN